MVKHSLWGNTIGFHRTFKDDLLASTVVFLVALPLCMGIALASGVPAEKAAAAGILTGVIGGIVVGLIGGSPLQVSGPAAGLSVIILELTQKHGWETIGLIILLAGAFQLAAGLLKLGQWFRAVSPAVIDGMLAGIGVLIVASQFHIMLDDKPKGNGLQNLAAIPAAAWAGVQSSVEGTQDDAARIGLLTIVLVVLWKPLAPRKLKLIPAPLVAVAVATAVAAGLGLPIHRVAVPDQLLEALHWPTLSGLGGAAEGWRLVVAALPLAFIASAETLLCATAVDKIHSGPRTNYDRELAAQGIGNMLCGLVGALPMTGVIVRSAANVEAGGRSQVAAVLHGFWLLACVCLCPFVLRWIPTAALAAILVYTGFKLVSLQAARTLWSVGKSELFIYAATVSTIVLTDLLTGVLVGIGLSVAKLVYTFSRLKVRVVEHRGQRRTILQLEGAATFLRLPRLAAALGTVPPGTRLHVLFDQLSYIDHACLDLLMSWEKEHKATGGTLEIDWDGLHGRFRPQRRGIEKTASKLAGNGSGSQGPRKAA